MQVRMDLRTTPMCQGDGGPAAVANRGARMGSALKDEIQAVASWHAMQVIRACPQQGATVDRILRGVTDVEASVAARRLVDDPVLETIFRSHLYRERFTVTELHTLTSTRRGGEVVAALIKACGHQLREKCPFCAPQYPNGEATPRDNYIHARFFCPHTSMIAVREMLHALLGERVEREGCMFASRQ